MKRSIRFGGLLVAAIVAAVAGALAHVAHAGPPEPVVPGGIEVTDGSKVFLVGHAVGVQIYSCNATPTGYSWAFVAPQANLYDDNGKLVVTTSPGRRGKRRTAAMSSGRS